MKTIFINDVEFELVPVYEMPRAIGNVHPAYVPFNPYGMSDISGYMLKPLPDKESLNTKESK